jgi:hypothetical protein
VKLGAAKNGDLAVDQTTLSNMMKIVHAEYNREMKQSYVLDEMQDPSKQDFFGQRHQVADGEH